MTRHVSFLGTVSLAALAVGCASSGTTAPVAAPAPAIAPPAPAEVAAEPAIESIEPGRFDMGKMWTFENAPVQYFEQAYGFRATKEWLDQVRLASLRIPGCTASFVSGEGLVLSNHHCARGATSAVTKEGENLLDDGFYAATLSDERPADNMWADQLVRMEDVTDLIERGVDPTTSEAEQLEAIEMR
ncbi:MAG: S46 family peptidase, partial [Gemmatimonadota bacterium]|nr:S46 family peptidase [Gemmatimonadota bacterium]